MTGPEFRAARKALRLSIPALAEILGTNERTIRRWEATKWEIPRMAAILVPAMVRDPDLLADAITNSQAREQL